MNNFWKDFGIGASIASSIFIVLMACWCIADMYFTFTGMNKTKALDHAEIFVKKMNIDPDFISCIDTGECVVVMYDDSAIKLQCPTITNKERYCYHVSSSKIKK